MSCSASIIRPELLAPAGNREMMHAAVENGADAIYFGLQEINARLRAGNFASAELPEIMAWLHERGVKGYVTLNTLVFPSELSEAAQLLKTCNAAGVDAVLIQDIGLAALAAQLVPELAIHASTQMTLTCAESVAGAQEVGLVLQRVVGARENSMRELARMQREANLEVEVFVHGALCVAYSGQCLTSEALGGRSANRGVCAQACRLPYDLIVDGAQKELGDVKYLLSPKDLCAYEDMASLMEIGITSLKIEGRLKTPEYVAATVQSYREAIDQVCQSGVAKMPPSTRRKLQMTFSRGFTGGYLHKIDHQDVVEGRFPKKRGMFLGRVERVASSGVEMLLQAPLRAGDGVVFDSGRPEEDEEGGRIYEIWQGDNSVKEISLTRPTTVRLAFGRGAVNSAGIKRGDRVWKTSDPQLDRALASSFSGENIHYTRPVDVCVSGSPGEPLCLRLSDRLGNEIELLDAAPVEEAQNRPLDRELLARQLGRMGGTPFHLGELSMELRGNCMVPLSRLNELRRRATEQLLKKRREVLRNRPVHEQAMQEMRSMISKPETRSPDAPEIAVMCRTIDQVTQALRHNYVTTVYTDFENPAQHGIVAPLIAEAGKKFVPATLRVMKPGEAGFVRNLLKLRPHALLVRNFAALHIARGEQPDLPLYADYSLNVANDLSASLLIGAGVSRITPSYDLNMDQLADLLSHASPRWFEITIHQHLPMFHMEHCVFCRFLSSGTDHTNCGRPCDTHTLELEDRMGFRHPVKADAGCRNTVYNAQAQSASEYLGMLLESGIGSCRIEFVSETADLVAETLDSYYRVISGQLSGTALWKKLRAVSKLGVTRGSFDQE